MSPGENRAFEEFLKNVKSEDYDWFLTLKLPEANWEMQCDEDFDLWISTMAQADGTRRFRWVRIAEKSSVDGSMLLHVLVGGRDTRRRWEWMEGWRHDVTQNGEVYSRRIPDTPKLKNFLKFMVARLGCGLRVRNERGAKLSIHGVNYSSPPKAKEKKATH